MKTSQPFKTKPFTQFLVPPQAFDAFNKELPIQEALGSVRGMSKREQADIRSVNWVPGVSGWRLTPTGLELGSTTGVLPAGSVTLAMMANVATSTVFYRKTAGTGVPEVQTLATLKTDLGLTGTNSGDQTSIVGITGTKAQFDTAVSDGNIVYVGDIPTLAAGTYTPTDSAHANLDGTDVTMTEAQYMRVGATVTVSGRFTADPTLTATATSFEIDLPVASNIGAAEDVAGVAFCGNIVSMGAEVYGVAANNTAIIIWKASDVTSQSWSYTFSYQII